jgi:hypothetical protein
VQLVNPLYESIFQVDVSIKGLVIVDDTPTFDEESVTLKSKAKQSTKSEEFFSSNF